MVEEGIDFLKLITSEVEPDLYRKASLTKLEAVNKNIYYYFAIIAYV